MSSAHPDYSVLAGRIFTVYLHKRIDKSFSDWVTTWGTGKSLYVSFTEYGFRPSLLITGQSALLDPVVVDVVSRHGPELDSAMVHARDFQFT